MKKILFLTALWVVLVLTQFTAKGQAGKAAGMHTDTTILKAFMDLRFGMFIHFGPVTLRGTEIGWSRGNQVPVKEYDQLYKAFDPVEFNANEWVRTARDAGMKYLIITAKHHDGFCLWPSAYTDYDIAATPFKKDLVGALAKACKKEGIRFGIYYSILDWYNPDYPMHSRKDSIPDPRANMDRYLSYMKNQLKELINNYHPYLLWFDGNWEKPWTRAAALDMYNYIKQLDPDVIINNRLGVRGNHRLLDASSVGDYATPEQVVGAIDMQHPWESCVTIGRQWSWKPEDQIKSLKTCLNFLAGTAGGNGNLLLNIGPMSNGKIESGQVQRLKEIGGWLKKYGKAIYRTKGGPYRPNKLFTATRKGNKVNILLLQYPEQVFTLANIPGRKILKAYFPGGNKVPFKQDDSGIHLTLPDVPPDSNCSVLVLEWDKNMEDVPLIN